MDVLNPILKKFILSRAGRKALNEAIKKQFSASQEGGIRQEDETVKICTSFNASKNELTVRDCGQPI